MYHNRLLLPPLISLLGPVLGLISLQLALPVSTLADAPRSYCKPNETNCTAYGGFVGDHNDSCAGECPTPTVGQINGVQLINSDPPGVSPDRIATGETIDVTGLYTADTTLGDFTVTATDSVLNGQAAVLVGSTGIWPTNDWPTATPAEMGMEQALLEQARDYALTAGGSGFIIRGGKLVMSWGSTSQLYSLKSTTKSIGVTALGLAIKDNLMSLDDLAQLHHPNVGLPPASNGTTGWLDDITLLHLATHAAGFDKSGDYTELLFEPGTEWAYSDGGANWLAEAITLAYAQDLNTVMFNRVFTPLGLSSSDLRWRNNNVREDTINGIKRREFGSGISADIDAMARIGYLYLRGGQWAGQQLIPHSFVDAVRTTVPGVVGLPENDPSNSFNASDHFGLLWWNNADGTMANVPSDVYWSWGIGESLIVVFPSQDIVVVRAGSAWQTGWKPDYSVIEPFIEPIALSANASPQVFLPIVIK